MKQLLLTLALVAAIPAMAIEEKDTIIHYADRQIVVSTDSVATNVAIYDKEGDELVKTKETSYVDGQEVERIFVSSPFVPIKKRNRLNFYGHLPDIFIGTNILNGGPEMHSRDSKSLEWGISCLQVGFGLNNSNSLGLVSGLQAGFIHNHFDAHYMLTDIDGTPNMVVNEAEGVKTSFLKYGFLRVPLMVEWKNTFSRSSAFIGFGCSIEWREEVRSKYRIGHKRYPITRNLDANTVGVNLEAYIGFGNFSLYAHYSLTKLMKSGPACHPFGIGFGLDF